MDPQRFDAVTRTLKGFPSRRDVLRGLTGAGIGLAALWSPDAAEAKKKRKNKKRKPQPTPTPAPAAVCAPKCGRKQCGNDGCGGSCGGCGTGQFCRSGTCCTPEPREVTCAGRCDTVTSIRTCGQPVDCSCPIDQVCLSNGSCARACDANSDCPDCLLCGPTTEGARYCISDICGAACTTSADCPLGTYCQPPAGCPGHNYNQCLPLCTGAPA